MPTIKKIKKTKVTKEKTVKKTADNALYLPIYNLEGEIIKKVTLTKEIFHIKSHPSVISQYIRVYLANQRQGRASTKTRGEVIGSTRKIYRQKGTGRARHGSIKAPIFVGGGVVGGPKPRDFSLKINNKQKKQALLSSLTQRYQDNSIVGFDYDLSSIKPKTKLIVKFIYKLNKKAGKVLFILPQIEKNNFILAARNIENVKIMDAMSINPYEILKAETIIIAQKALAVLEKHFIKQ